MGFQANELISIYGPLICKSGGDGENQNVMNFWAHHNDYKTPSPTFFLPLQVSVFEGYVFRLFLFIFMQEDDACLVHVESYTHLVPSFLKVQFYDGYGQNMISEA